VTRVQRVSRAPRSHSAKGIDTKTKTLVQRDSRASLSHSAKGTDTKTKTLLQRVPRVPTVIQLTVVIKSTGRDG
jgi:hypothetical protein